ncbi:hypothetical protein THRCLA_01343 [Thraustotheca clavata]|uniref:Endonuclease/exonuclease/phosphatase domain-containing protein n=1 Tax=Thraustotheca clavata TaxID=74557 RepID=A0A1W0A8J5_9STRA|nr:hypothetical protein THRCLA_01343 [Thraustotheca clavata]
MLQRIIARAMSSSSRLLPLPFVQSKQPNAFSVLQLNILASNLATPAHFPYVQPNVLTWEARKKILLKQLQELDADILCLEECSDYWTYFRPALASLGYESAWVKRPSTHRSTWSGEKKMDGCGIFFRQERFKLRECESFNFHDEHDRVALVVLLQEHGDEKSHDNYVMVGCTHLWWNSQKVDHQMKQLRELDQEVRLLRSNLETKYNITRRPLPFILCGDFNNSPSSPLYSYMLDFFLQPLAAMKSAYANYRALEATPDAPTEDINEPLHTTVNYRRCWAIDYIWYTVDSLKPQAILEIPSEDELRAEDGPEGWHEVAQLDPTVKNYNGIPNSKYGSDHVPIMASFIFKD